MATVRHFLIQFRTTALKLKEDLRVFTGEDMQQEVFSIKARNILDISATYDVTDSASGQKVGALRRKGLKSMALPCRDSVAAMPTRYEVPPSPLSVSTSAPLARNSPVSNSVRVLSMYVPSVPAFARLFWSHAERSKVSKSQPPVLLVAKPQGAYRSGSGPGQLPASSSGT
ncbi:hypothetical protein [Archangium lansingense]|uniref:Uncharacterized protein n=1 Tax=Archangium lansingense TaxID=2995310 RepID=A0ABT4APK5_9BACT|nr:hypothetical protein [Archangium lansinium]MCY1083605.1 hypothetical protein [Archangium lansinium]